MAPQLPRVVVIGGGFAGLYAAKALRRAQAHLTLVDRRNFHLFQPLLYQVATGGLSPGDIASPLRAVLQRHPRAEVLNAEVTAILPLERRVQLREGHLEYDFLVVATGSLPHYFGQDQWAAHAPALKSIEDALEIRRRVLLAFETAEREPDLVRRQAWLHFAVVGAGPTGVELAGSLAELAHTTLRRDFRRIDPTQARVSLIENADRVLPPYVPSLSAKAGRALAALGVELHTGTRVEAIDAEGLLLSRGEQKTRLEARTVLWAAGMRASPLGALLAQATGAALDRSGRVQVGPDLSLPGHPEILVIGDLAACPGPDGKPLPGVAPVAMQQGRYAAASIRRRLRGRTPPPFRFFNKGSLAVIGRHAAVADFGWVRFAGWPAWLAWLFIHIAYLIEFDNKLMVLFQWGWNYLTRKRGARLITGDPVLPRPSTPGTP